MFDTLTQENFVKEVKSQTLGGLFEIYLYVASSGAKLKMISRQKISLFS